jgi:hypothetical protein
MSIVAIASPAPFTYHTYNVVIRLKAAVRIGFNADPNPAFQVNEDPDRHLDPDLDPDPDPQIQI